MCCSSLVKAQEFKYELGANAGVASYLGDANPKNPFASLGGSAGIVARYNYNFRTAFSGTLDYFLLSGNTQRISENKFPNQAQTSFTTHGAILALRGEYNFFPYSDRYPFLQTRRFTPYISGSVACAIAAKDKGVSLLPGVGISLGVKWKVRNRVNLFASLEGTHFFSDSLDTPSSSSAFLSNPYGTKSSIFKGGDGMVRLMLGISFEFQQRGTNCNQNEQTDR